MTKPSQTKTPPEMPTLAQRIWSDPTCLLLIFAGGSAEFAVHPNVDWLFYTGKLPSDPIGRFFSTIEYLREMLIRPADQREELAKALRGLHTDIEHRRGGKIPDVAYRDVLSMDIYYSIQAANLVYPKPLDSKQCDEVVAEMVLFGDQMGIPDLPESYDELCAMRQQRFGQYQPSQWTDKLLDSYHQALGLFGYQSLLGFYPLLLEPELMAKLPLKRPILTPAIRLTFGPLYRTNLIDTVYRFGLPRRMRDVVRTWKSSCAQEIRN
jgi:hypothetical protein